MKILFVTAYFPPCDYGWGYMRICEQVADGLDQMGHQVAVLTSKYRHGEEFKSYPVHRLLNIDPDWTLSKPAPWQFFYGRKSRENQDISHLMQLVDKFAPDVIFVWHAHGLSRAMLQKTENLTNIPTVYYFANYLPELPDEYVKYWQDQPNNKLIRLLKGVMSRIALRILHNEGKPIRLRYAHSISVSHYVRQRLLAQGLIGEDAVVIPNGVDLAVFGGDNRQISPYGVGLKCVIAGRIAPEKGIHTVLHAFGVLNQQGSLRQIQLNIIGDGPADYKAELQQIVGEYQLQSSVDFIPSVPIEQMPRIYAEHDILLLPSEWHEPLSCTMLEAMASGLLVIGTDTGGSSEALFHERTGLIFSTGDPLSLVEQLSATLDKPDRIAQLAQAGKKEVIDNFNIQKSVTRIEEYLLCLVQRSEGKLDESSTTS